jgi:hypothetical protein
MDLEITEQRKERGGEIGCFGSNPTVEIICRPNEELGLALCIKKREEIGNAS